MTSGAATSEATPDHAGGSGPGTLEASDEAAASAGYDRADDDAADFTPQPAGYTPRLDSAAAARVFDGASTRRRPVVFEEDDELDVPDFLK